MWMNAEPNIKAERSNGYPVPTLLNDGAAEWYQQDWPHEFYVKKSGDEER